ncbi:hypothetical protein C2E23DRAFT_813811 [Lenzites betulinus]|nr:hypothetical protein C2E23DRAFT_813811 [Lenzites betulinus]
MISACEGKAACGKCANPGDDCSRLRSAADDRPDVSLGSLSCALGVSGAARRSLLILSTSPASPQSFISALPSFLLDIYHHPTMSASRYIPHGPPTTTDLKAMRQRINHALIENVQRVHRHPSSSPKVYVGSAGEIIMDMRAFAAIPNHTFPNTPTSALIAVPFHEPHDGKHVSYLETSIGPATLVLVRQLRLRQSPDSNAHKHARRGKLDSELLEELELQESWRGAADLIGDAVEVALAEPPDDDGCEVLYGRAGLLYALLLLRAELLITVSYLTHAGTPGGKVVREVEALCSDENVQALVDDIMARGVLGATRYAQEMDGEDERAKAPPLMWRWHGTRYLGAAHGIVGILHIVLHAPAKVLEPHWPKILATIEWLLAIQDPQGNWPSKVGTHMTHISGGAASPEDSKQVLVDEETDDTPVQWCHGAPGYMMLFSALLRRAALSPNTCPLPDALRKSVVAATTRAGDLVYERGLLRKGVGLCHGVGGSVYALLALSDALDAPPAHPQTPGSHAYSTQEVQRAPQTHVWLLRAAHLADLATAYQGWTQKGEMGVPERPYSLYEGIAGMCCAWAEVLLRLQNGAGGGHHTGVPEAEKRRGGMPGFDDIALLD